MKKFVKKEEGITLIALIITVIVMLILVAITINVALNGGLFEKAKNARDLTLKETEREELMSIALGLFDVNSGITQSELVTELSKSKNTYTVDADKTIENSKYVVSSPSGTIWEINLVTAEVKEFTTNTITNNVWKTQYSFTTPNARFYTNSIDEAKYVGNILESEYILAFKIDGSAYNSWGDDLTNESIRARIEAKKNNDTSAPTWFTISSNYIEAYSTKSYLTWRYEVKDDLNVHVYLNNEELGVLYLVTE